MIGIGEPALLSETTGALHAFNIPLVSVMPQPLPPLTASGGGESGRGGKGGQRGVNGAYNNILTTAPDMAGQARVSSSIFQVWSLTEFYSVDFSKSRIGVKKCVFNKRTIKVCVSCC